MSVGGGNAKQRDDERPLAGYAVLMVVFNAIAGSLAALVRRRGLAGEIDRHMTPGNLLLFGVATHKISRLIAKDRVTSPLRAPFVEYEGNASGSEVDERPVGTGMRRAIGDLVTCPFCVSQWVAMMLAFAAILVPKPARFVAGLFSIVAISDLINDILGLLRTTQERISDD